MSKEPQNDNFNLHGDYNPGAQAAEAVHGDAVSSTDSQPSLEAGVRKAELIAATWGRKQLVIAYLGLVSPLKSSRA